MVYDFSGRIVAVPSGSNLGADWCGFLVITADMNWVEVDPSYQGEKIASRLEK